MPSSFLLFCCCRLRLSQTLTSLRHDVTSAKVVVFEKPTFAKPWKKTYRSAFGREIAFDCNSNQIQPLFNYFIKITIENDDINYVAQKSLKPYSNITDNLPQNFQWLWHHIHWEKATPISLHSRIRFLTPKDEHESQSSRWKKSTACCFSKFYVFFLSYCIMP